VSEERWLAVDEFVTGLLVGEDDALRTAVSESARAGLPQIAVSPPQGKLLYLLARIHGARRILELGTLGGYSTIWLARALAPGGRLVTLELQQQFAEVARANIQRAGLAALVEQRVGPAIESLTALRAEAGEPFDLVFIDADKAKTPEYFTEALELTRPGGIILVDNVVRDGELANQKTDDAGARGMRRLHKQLAAGGPWSATTIQTVGVKGYDGFTLILLEQSR
jgi:predicted O-methyltransferase YrrM